MLNKEHPLYDFCVKLDLKPDLVGSRVQIWAKTKNSPYWQGYLHAGTYLRFETSPPVNSQSHVCAESFDTVVLPSARRKGLATALYDSADNALKVKLSPSAELSEDILHFWIKRAPHLSKKKMEQYSYGNYSNSFGLKIPDAPIRADKI